MKKSIKILAVVPTLLLAGVVLAGEIEIEALDVKVSEKVQQIEQSGLLPTSIEIEVIMGDIIDEEVTNTTLTVDQAVEKYQLTPTLERYIRIKKAIREQSFTAGQIVVKPIPPQ